MRFYREIRYRGYDKSIGKYVYGGIVAQNKEEATIVDASGYFHQVPTISVGVYTGCYDKHGRPIYEDDILEVAEYANESFKGTVCVDEVMGEFYLDGDHDFAVDPFEYYESKDMEIVGDEYRNALAANADNI